MGFFNKNQPVTGADAVRPVNEPAAAAIEQALGQYGQVMHAVDPNRGVALAAGGPPVWSVGLVSVPGTRPYTLLVTYGLSYTFSPEPGRSHVRYELSLAIPHEDQASPWGDAFLRAQAFYVVSQKAELKLGECMPFRGIPITRMAFGPEFHAQLPESSLVGMLVAQDPVIPTIKTEAGDIPVRRLVGIDQMEIDRAVTWDPAALLELIRGIDPLLLTPLKRKPYIPQLAAQIQPLADRD
ncbi:MAG TPA: suppressor of fused domain protein, partial [Kofleriaceae bacterium]